LGGWLVSIEIWSGVVDDCLDAEVEVGLWRIG
jgi:hypothetical protein